MDSFWGSFLEILSWPLVGFLVGGTLLGLILGVIPGLGGITILALLLPLTYTLDFQYSIVLMTAIMAVTITSDTIPTILIGVPPTAGASATLLDGHAMALNGEAARALGASYTSSIIGGVLGAICLWLSIPILRPFVLAFGPPEVFVVALWGLTMLGALSSGNMLKGLAAGFLGILLGTIGRSPTSGIYRYSFDIPYLIDGLKIVTVSLGLFAIPEVIKMATAKGSIPGGNIRGNLLRGQLQGMLDVLRHWGLLIRSSMVGVWIGVVPGVGSVTADWFAYAHAVQSAKDKSRFGKGDVRGVIAPEASNNSCKGGDFIPTLAFGVPGSASMSLVLGAFMIAGIHPGPNMLTTDIGITYKIIWALAVANIVGGGICLLATSQIAKLLYLPKHYLIAVITTFLILAVYIGTKDIGDILVMIIFGVLGFVMKQYGWARPPLIVGFVLSDITEWNFVISVTLMGISWLWRPMVMGMIVIFVLNQVWTYLKEKQIAGDEAVVRVAPRPSEGMKMKIKHESYFTIALMAVSFAAGVYALMKWDFKTALVPVLCGAAIFILCFFQLIKELKGGETKNAQIMDSGFDKEKSTERENLLGAIKYFGILGGLYISIYIIGIYPSIGLFVLLYLLASGEVSAAKSIVFASVVVGVVYVIINEVAQEALPDPLLYRLLS